MMKKLLAGFGIGFSAGYACVRATEAWREWSEPAETVAKAAPIWP